MTHNEWRLLGYGMLAAVLMALVLVPTTGAFTLRCVSNDTVIDDLRKQGALDTFLTDADELYAEFRKRFGNRERPN
jgi:hypothetical protein